MLDPLSSFSLAAGIVQFIDFISTIISESREVYGSTTGLLKENADLESMSATLSEFIVTLSASTKIGASAPFYSPEEGRLKSTAESCREVAEQILTTLQDLKIDKIRNRTWQSVRSAIKSRWSGQKLEALRRKMSDFRNQMVLQFSKIIRNEQLKVIEVLQQCQHIGNDQMRQLEGLQLSMTHTFDALATANEFNREIIGEAFDRLNQVLLTTANVSRNDKILRSLYFKTMRNRHSRIFTAPDSTYGWIFRADSQSCAGNHPGSQFQDWLRHRDGIYWVAGKPGCGKSTLMKFLTGHKITEECLLEWAKDEEVTVASFYFWNPGNEMQKTQTGLLRSLLYEILRQCPNLTPLVHTPDLDNQNLDENDIWTLSDLFQAMQTLRSPQSLASKFCFFIDGIDEYEGDHNEIVKALGVLTSSPNIKMCVSSRPWNLFEDAYGHDQDRKLYLQDLTRRDIESFTANTIKGNAVFPSLSDLEKAQCQELIQEIVKKSCGVFLWVFLVVRSLNDGLTNGDSLSTLQTRLHQLPSDLETFFYHILNQVEEIYRPSMARSFQEALQASEPMPLLAYSFLDEEDPDFAITLRLREVQKPDMRIRNQRMSRRINGRSKGLLEIHRGWQWPEFWGDKVEFFHRTVRDFLLTTEMQDFLNRNSDHSLNINRSLSRAYLCLIKTLPSYGAELLSPYAEKCMLLAHQAELETNTTDISMLDELENVIRTHDMNTGVPPFETLRNNKSVNIPRTEHAPSFLDIATAHGLHLYVAEKTRT